MSLYSHEQVEVWDPETGRTNEEYVDQQEKEEIQTFVKLGKSLESLKKSRGWKFVEEFLSSNEEKYKQLLTHELDFEKIKRLQEAIKAYGNVRAYVDQTINQAKGFDTNRTPPKEG